MFVDALFQSVAEDGGKAQTEAEEMEISTRSRGENISSNWTKYDIRVCVNAGKLCFVTSVIKIFPSGSAFFLVCMIFGLSLKFQIQGQASGAEPKKERCRVRRTRQMVTRLLKRPPAKLKRRRNQVPSAAARTR